MTHLGNLWQRHALFALCLLLMIWSGLAGCAPTVSGVGALTADSDLYVDPWPQQLTSGDNTFSVFQPQYESWNLDQLRGRAAVAVENQASPQPTYGVIWFTAQTEVDKESRMVTLEDLTISKTDFPTAPNGGATYAAALRQALVSQPLTMALDRLQAELELERVEKPGRTVEVKNDPPRIIVSQEPALLIRIDGQPELRQVAGTGLLRAINTRVLLLFDQSAGHYYCWLMDRWVAAPQLEGPWASVADPPAALATAKAAATQSGEVDLLDNPDPDLK